MANMFAVNVYQINDNALLKVVDKQAFHASNVKFRTAPVVSSTNGAAVYQTAAGTNLYGIVQELPRGLQTGSTNYYVVETVAQLVSMAG
jgi:hypothetical protein